MAKRSKKALSLSELREHARRLFGRPGSRREYERPRRREAPAAPDAPVGVPTARFGRISLDEIRNSMGDRWPVLEPRVRAAAEAVIARNLTRGDVFEMQADGSYSVLFARLDEGQAEFKCRVIAREVRERLLGSGSTFFADPPQGTAGDSSVRTPPLDDLEFVLRDDRARSDREAQSPGATAGESPGGTSSARVLAGQEQGAASERRSAGGTPEERGPSEPAAHDGRARRQGPEWREQVVEARAAPRVSAADLAGAEAPSAARPKASTEQGLARPEQILAARPTPSLAEAGAPAAAGATARGSGGPGWREQLISPGPRSVALVPVEPLDQHESGWAVGTDAVAEGADRKENGSSPAGTRALCQAQEPPSKAVSGGEDLIAAGAAPAPRSVREPGWRDMGRRVRVEPVVAPPTRRPAADPPEPVWCYTPVWDFRKMSLVRFRLTAGSAGAAPPKDSRLTDEEVFARDLAGVARALSELMVLSDEGRRLLLICVISQSSLGTQSRREQFLTLLARAPAAARRLLNVELFNPEFQANLAIMQFAEALESLGVASAAGVSLESKTAIRPAGMPLAAAAAELGEATGEAEAMLLLNTFSRRSAQVGLDAAVHRLDSRAMVIAAIAAGVRYLSGEAVHPPLTSLGDGLRFEPVNLYRDLLVGSHC